jgi:hypothetical protein
VVKTLDEQSFVSRNDYTGTGCHDLRADSRLLITSRMRTLSPLVTLIICYRSTNARSRQPQLCVRRRMIAAVKWGSNATPNVAEAISNALYRRRCTHHRPRDDLHRPDRRRHRALLSALRRSLSGFDRRAFGHLRLR